MDALIASLLRPEAYPHPTGAIQLRETHSAWVLLTGPYAYKLRKPVNFGFLDFSTAERRRFFAAEELRLNRRLAPDLYLDLVPVHGPPERAHLGGDGPLIELAVRMRQFDEQQLLTAVVERGELPEAALDGLAGELARFHSLAAVAPADGPYGTPAAVRQPVNENLAALNGVAELQGALGELRPWLAAEAARLEPFFLARLQRGHIRECHGDLHLGNLWLEGNRIRVFDCLEFNPALRWIDTISDLAFLVMDLEVRDQGPAGRRLLNGWLDAGGDWPGLRGWRWYSVYRALVRAKVAELRRRQCGGETPGEVPGGLAAIQAAAAERDRYVDQALRWSRPRPRALLLTHGVSGSGKSWLSERLAPRLGALRLRSDVERKRLLGLWGEPRQALLSGDPYRGEVSELLFAHTLPAQAEAVLAGGHAALVDATFLRQADRRPFLALAERLGVPLLILALHCPPELARTRITARLQAGRDPSDAGLAVLERQLGLLEPLSPAERFAARVVEVEPGADPAALAAQLAPGLQA